MWLRPERVAGDEYVDEVIPEPDVVDILNVAQVPHPLPGAFAGGRGVVRGLAVLGTHEDLGRLDGPSGPARLEPGVALARNGQAPPEREAVVHLGLPVLPLHALVGRRPAVYQINVIAQQPPYQRRRHDDQESDGADAHVGLDAVCEEDEVVVPGLLRMLPQAEDAAAGPRSLGYQAESQRAAVRRQHCRRQQQQEEPMLVPVPHAVVDEDAVVVQPRHAALADGAVFRARRLEQATAPAFLARVEDGEVIRVQRHVARVCLRCDDARVSECRQVEEHVRQDGRNDAGDPVEAAHPRPCAWQVQKLADGQQQDVEDQDGWMAPVPDVMPECAPRGDDSASSENSVKR